jgi:hypothetical protein
LRAVGELPICGRNRDARTHERVVASQPEFARPPLFASAAGRSGGFQPLTENPGGWKAAPPSGPA